MDDELKRVLASACLEIKAGITCKDWNRVIRGYNALSGDEIPEEKKSDLELLREEIDTPKPKEQEIETSTNKKRRPPRPQRASDLMENKRTEVGGIGFNPSNDVGG